MSKKIKLIILIVFILIFTISFWFIFWKKNNSLLKLTDKKRSISKTGLVKKNKPTITPIFISSKPSQKQEMYFVYKKENIDYKNKAIFINLEGDANSKSDAIDLLLEINENIVITKIVDGNSFNFYPRKIINQDSILITGVALGEKGATKLAQPQSNFIKIYLSIKNFNQKASIKLNQRKSKIFFGGEDITNLKKSFSEINLN